MKKTEIKTTKEGKLFESMLKSIDKLQVRIGYQQGQVMYDEDGKEVDLCDVAAWNELGNEIVPSRPFMRDAVDNHEDQINEFFAIEKKAFISGVDEKKILNDCGVFFKDLIQNEIRDGEFLPNSPYTIEKKGSSHPLIDTGRLRQSVNFVIQEKGRND